MLFKGNVSFCFASNKIPAGKTSMFAFGGASPFGPLQRLCGQLKGRVYRQGPVYEGEGPARPAKHTDPIKQAAPQGWVLTRFVFLIDGED